MNWRKIVIVSVVFCGLLSWLCLSGFHQDEKTTDPVPQQTSPNKKTPSYVPEWTEFPAEKNLSDRSWGEFLTDVENHLPAKFGTQYRSNDKITHCHETTHGINSHLRNTFGQGKKNGFYVGGNKAAIIAEPKARLQDVADAIPKGLRGNRYQLYLHQQQQYFANEPTYIFDEWVAYTNGGKTGVELAGKARNGKNDSLIGILEFNVYALCVLKVAKDKDPNYDTKQMANFIAWNMDRGLRIYEEGIKTDELNWDDGKYLEKFQKGEEGKSLREFARSVYGDEWCKEKLGFKD